MKKSLFLSILAAVYLLLCLVGCGQSKEPTILDFEERQTSQQGNETHPNGEFRPNTDTSLPNEDAFIGYTFTPKNSELVSGKVYYTLTDVHIVTRQEDIPTQGGFIYNPSVWQMVDGKEQSYRYPEFIQEDGSFLEDCYLILADVTIHSENAEWNTDPKTGGQFEDPYMFIATKFTLVDMTDKWPEGNYFVTEATYFSGLQECAHDRIQDVIRLMPGEEKSYTFGFFIGGYKSDGTKTDLSQLCLCNTYGNPDSVLIRLGLGD